MASTVTRALRWSPLACSLLACAGAEQTTTAGSMSAPTGVTDDTGPMQVTEGSTTAGSDDSDTTLDPSTSDASDSDTDTGTDTDAPTSDGCAATIRFALPQGASAPRLAGEWHDFDLSLATPFEGPDGDGLHAAQVTLDPGLWAYKIVYSQGGADQWVLDPGQGRRKYVGDIENSAVLVPDCALPSLAVETSETSRQGPGQGSYQATLRFTPGTGGASPDPDGYSLELDDEGVRTPLSPGEYAIDPETGDVSITLSNLADGKYTVRAIARDSGGHSSQELRLVLWIEAAPFAWDGALIYMVMTDRFRDGDPGNNPGPTPMADPRGDWYGGDLQGLRQEIAEGTLDELGVRAIWLTPFQENPQPAFLASDGFHQVTGYHGYWPIRAREVEPRIGGEAALRALVAEAHAHGIRILQDFVVNHVHEDHEYMAAHPEWFRTGCVCGTQDCDWTGHALDCMFAPYLPDINHTVPEANAAFVDDAVYWLDEFNLDGLRVDAVKHVEEVATRNLAAAVREGFEAAGTHYFLMGETAMGWGDCDDPCNDENYQTIARYIGPHGLDGQFDFVLYHAVAYNTFAYGDKGMLHADYWLTHGLSKWPAGAVMTPYVGSHDTPRFATLADYRGQDPQHDRGVAHSQWDNTAQAPGDAEPYRRARVAMAWLFGLPGAPLLYYGDEYGQWGGADPNNRLMWRPQAELSADEAETLAFVRKLGAARTALPALRVGAYAPLHVDEDTLVFARHDADAGAAIVGLTRAGVDVALEVFVDDIGLSPGTSLIDHMGGPASSVSLTGKVALTIPAGGAVILAPE